MDKEHLTIKNIKSDILRYYSIEMLVLTLISFYFLVIPFIPIAIFGSVKVVSTYILISILVILLLNLYYLVRIIQTFLNKFHISEDDMIGYPLECGKHYAGSKESFYIDLRKTGTYHIVPQNCYKWSKIHKTTSRGVFLTSSVGDEFYVVSFNNKRPVIIYNKKLFEYQK